MKHLPHLHEALQFLLLDIQKQLQALSDALENQDASLVEKSLNRVDYIENAYFNLLQRVRLSYPRCPSENTTPQNTQYSSNTLPLEESTDQTLIIQIYEHLGHSLNALSRELSNMAFELEQLPSLKLLQKKAIFAALAELNKGLSLILPAMEAESLSLAIDICRLQNRIEQYTQQQLNKYKKKLKHKAQTDSLLQACFILKDINTMGLALLRLGEGIISGNLGQFIQIDRYHALEATLPHLERPLALPDLNIHSMGETKSGCTISGLSSSRESEGEILAIFKEGKKHKLQEEKAGIESWHQKFPGIAPQVYSYQKNGDKAALLFEYLTGKTFDKLLLQKGRAPLKAGLTSLFKTLSEIWQETQIEEAIPAQFMSQLSKRLKSLYQVHPEFNLKGLQIGEMKQAPLEDLIKQAQQLESKLVTPQAVYIHGDFNTDNILYDPLSQQISFIDLHRSEYLDYVQDLSVLMVSFYRIANFDSDIRKQISLAMEAIYDFGLDHAEQINDQDYELRMALGLGRSFITSTRFVLDKAHAKAMYFKGRYLIEQVIQLKKAHRSFYQLPKELFYD